MELSKTGVASSNDRVGGITTLIYGGSLVATNIGARHLGGGRHVHFVYGEQLQRRLHRTWPAAALGWARLGHLESHGERFDHGGFDVTSPPVIVSQPQDLMVSQGDPARFSVVAAGARPLAYQWRRDNTNLAGATATYYAIGGCDHERHGCNIAWW